MANDVQIIIKAVDKASAEMKKVSRASDGMASALKGAGIAAGVAATAVAAGVTAYKQLVAPVIAYNKSILDASRATRMATEDLSRFVQVGDDMGVSMDSITRALQMATKNGFAPSITALADLADKANAMNTPTERAAYLAKLFGRNWAELDPILQLGGQRIRELAAAQKDGLVVTEAEIKKTERLRLRLDELNDSWISVRNTIVMDIIDAYDKEAAASSESEALITRRAEAYQYMVEHGLKPTVAAVSAIAASMREAEQSDFADRLRDSLTPAVQGFTGALEDLSAQALLTQAAQAILAGDLSLGKSLYYQYQQAALLDATLKSIADRLAAGFSDVEYQITEYFVRVQGIAGGNQALNPPPPAAPLNLPNPRRGGVFAAAGADFIVPPGYANDSFPLMVSSGEHVVVTPGNTYNQQNQSRNISISSLTVGSDSDKAKFDRQMREWLGA
jgi:hypothetical protein